jgi:hypothetical protein
MDREETRAGTRNSPTNEHLIRSTGVLSTACREGDLRSVREAPDWLGVAASNVARKGGGQSGSRRGLYGALSSALLRRVEVRLALE